MKKIFFALFITAIACFANGCIQKKTIKSAGSIIPDTENVLGQHQWELIELSGNGMAGGSNNKPPFILFDAQAARVNGFAGCNNFRGSYKAREENRISFSKIVATRMACPELSIETALLQVLETADNYTIADGILSINKARMAPLARFKAAPKNVLK